MNDPGDIAEGDPHPGKVFPLGNDGTGPDLEAEFPGPGKGIDVEDELGIDRLRAPVARAGQLPDVRFLGLVAMHLGSGLIGIDDGDGECLASGGEVGLDLGRRHLEGGSVVEEAFR